MSQMPYLKRKDLIFIIFLILWFIFNGNFLILQAASIKHSFYLGRFSLDQKYEFIDGSFYDFARHCLKEIPEDASVVFLNKSRHYKERTKGWLKAEYVRQRLAYYLCPRKFISEDSGLPVSEAYKVVFEITPPHFSLRLYYPGQEPDGSP
jgi:hypothetical protein